MIIDTKGNKKHSAIFTPMDVARLMAEQDVGYGTVLDPTCGSGNLLVAVAELRLRVGVRKKRIALDLHGYDIQQEYVDQCRHRLIELLGFPKIICRNIVLKNFIEK